MSYHRYSTAQRVGVAGVLVGFMLCVVAVCTPYWKRGELDLASATGLSILRRFPIFSGVRVVSLRAGVFYYCLQEGSAKDECKKPPIELAKERDKALLGMLTIQLLLAGFSLMAAVWGQYSKVKDTRVTGVIAFVSACAGFTAIALFVTITEDSWKLRTLGASLDWGFYVYIAGIGVMMAASVLLCCSVPVRPLGGLVRINTVNNQMMNRGGPYISSLTDITAPYNVGPISSSSGIIAPYRGGPLSSPSSVLAPYKGGPLCSPSGILAPYKGGPISSPGGIPPSYKRGPISSSSDIPTPYDGGGLILAPNKRGLVSSPTKSSDKFIFPNTETCLMTTPTVGKRPKPQTGKY
ncbi:uncharacterized protein LOC106011465 [Aplysia californica]|uniref:Uncharacterized protein LOC106011465 n=1 Tax=Aplysia californica TaxID=6500 RepID=A0ABM0ZXU2_APLCA|nr:uncharacterized protein LOC106011465 [Aplysia californica]